MSSNQACVRVNHDKAVIAGWERIIEIDTPILRDIPYPQNNLIRGQPLSDDLASWRKKDVNGARRIHRKDVSKDPINCGGVHCRVNCNILRHLQAVLT